MYLVVQDEVVVYRSEFISAAGEFARLNTGEICEVLSEVLAKPAPQTSNGKSREPRKALQKQD